MSLNFESPDSTRGSGSERDIYTVSRLNREVRTLLERGLGVLWVQGELSNFSQPGSGHWYFSFKDRDAQLRCAMFRLKNTAVGFTPRNGQQLLVRGRVSLYEPRGDYQLLVEHLEEAGIGALRREFERLKAKLAAEGLFASERKRVLPRFPRRIGIITSPAGAAIRDILHILARRYPPADVLVYPAAVQGEAAVPALVAALKLASARRDCDVLILARGGGALEDLWAFNDERLARAIAASAVPVVSGVGHEIDFTIADFVADVRAPTPSGAAELVTPDRHACLEALARTAQRLRACLNRDLRTLSARLSATRSRLERAHPGARLAQQAQRLDELEARLHGGFVREHRALMRRFAGLNIRLTLAHPGARFQQLAQRGEGLQQRLLRAQRTVFAGLQQRLTLAAGRLDAVSPLATLTRGYAIVTAADGAVLTDVRKAATGEEIRARLAHGTLTARILGKEGTPDTCD